MRKPEKLFSAEDRARLAEAVREAERATSGEIVPYVVGRSDSYDEAPWRAGTLLGFLVMAILSGAWVATDLWLPYGLVEAAALTAAGYLVGAAMPILFPRSAMLFVSPSTVNRRVEERARLAFLEEQVFATRDRTGILIFLSLLEHRVRVIGDNGINAKVRQEEWDGIVDGIIRGMKRGAPAGALHRAIIECGELLSRFGVERKPDDTDELDDTVRIRPT
ncbi:MAG: hypothetical protein QHI48_06810 [Bacteroidota bacterium]|nr:hypothetical protein [Bacteroidota bacterium]